MSAALLTIEIRFEQDVVMTRQRARQIAELLGFDAQEQTRIATAVSEIARNAFQYAKGGRVEFRVEGESPQSLLICIRDKGSGIADLNTILDGRYKSETGMGLGIIGSKRLMEQFEIESSPSNGTTVRMGKPLPKRVPVVNANRLARIADELIMRSPLNAMLGWTRLLNSRKFDEATTARAMQTIERSAKSQAQLVEDLLDVSRIIQGKLRLNVRPVELVSVIEAAIETVRPAAQAKEISLQSVLDPSAGPVAGDVDRLQQVVWNLLSNAIKFTPKGGCTQVRLERVNSHVEIAVTDTGKGINPEFVPYVFERFRQADSSSTRVYSGLGLGLAIVRQLVELHGGTVRAESEGEGKGATFTVKLPLIPIRVERHPSERVHATTDLGVPFDNPPALNGVRVLLVDDEADSREFLVAALEECEAKVFGVASASEALEAVSQFKPDVLVSDIGMPLEDGYSLIARVRKLSPEQGGEIPAIALTAYARAEDRMKAIAAGFQMHISKPVEPAELVTVVASLARHK